MEQYKSYYRVHMSADQKIPFNKPWITGDELANISAAMQSGKVSGDGNFTALCHRFFHEQFNFRSCALTNSCTDALEMAAILLDIQPGDEVIVPSYTFVSTANAFILRGAKIRFADSLPDHPNVDPQSVAALVTSRTKAIVPVHYAGMACNMEALGEISQNSGASLVEDAAHSIGAYYNGKPLGSFGTFGTYSFHESKNVSSGEGGLLIINDEKFIPRAEIIREKGTDRTAFFRGERDKYGWVDIGSSFLPSNITAAFLYAQLQQMKAINEKRVALWNRYHDYLARLEEVYPVQFPRVPEGAVHNGHMYYFVCDSVETRDALIAHLSTHNIHAVFHYQSLHASRYFRKLHDGRALPGADRYSNCLVRLPMYAGLTEEEVDRVCEEVEDFFRERY